VDQFGRRKKKQFSGLSSQLATMVERVQQVAKQTRARVFDGNTTFDEKLVSVFEPQTETIRKGKATKPTEFGKLVKVQEAENQIITHFEVYDERPADSALLVDAVGIHQQQTGALPRIVAADAGFYSQANEKKLQKMGVKNAFREFVDRRNSMHC
jgi:transposase, IS5 family